MQFLLMDFGTTRVKSAIANLETGKISHVKSRPACVASEKGTYNEGIPIALLQEQFASICKHYYLDAGISFEGIMLCCQMHGFGVLNGNGRPASGYITWKDERSTTPINGESSWDLFNRQFGMRFRQVSGMNPRPGLPVFNLLHMARQGVLPQDSLIASLAEILCMVSGDCTGIIHPTMLAGLGVYDIERKKIAKEFISFISDEAGCMIRCFSIGDERQCGGYWHSGDGRKIPIFVGVGDHQCSVLGAGNIPGKTLSINMGTGSQVSAIDFNAGGDETEQRPYFGDSSLTTITHIPAGRALVEYIGFLENVAGIVGTTGSIFWDMLAAIDMHEALQPELKFNMGIFSSCWHYSNGGSINNIVEGSFTLKNYLIGLIGGFCQQYKDAVQTIDPSGKLNNCILSGGIPQKLPQLSKILSKQLDREVERTKAVDEALIGLRTLALIASGRVSNYCEASKMFRLD